MRAFAPEAVDKAEAQTDAALQWAIVDALPAWAASDGEP